MPQEASGRVGRVLSLNHVGLTVSDLEASLAFYVETVGMGVASRGFKTGGEWFDTLTGGSGAVIDAVRLELGGTVLQLVQYHEGGADAPAATGHSRVGNMHLCVDVDDVEAVHARLSQEAALNATPIVELPLPGVRSFYVEDPDGVPVEFLERRE